MKKLSLFLFSTLILAACSQSYTVATEQDLKDHPELEGVISTWQDMVDAGNSEDCQTVLDHMRKSLSVTDESCAAILAYLKDAPSIDWTRTDWVESAGKAKIYKDNGASVTSFILDTRDNVWRADTLFWEK